MSKSKGFAKSATLIGVITLLSKFLGFFREMLIASKFGAGWETDTYVVSTTATFLIIGMIAAAFNTVLIPIFSEIDNLYGKKKSSMFLNNLLTVMFFATAALTILYWLTSPLIVKILATGFEGKQYDLAVRLNRLGAPIIMGMCFSFIFSGFLQSRERFLASTATGFSFNLVQIFFLVFLSTTFGLEGLMVALVVSIFGQVLMQIPSSVKEGFRYKWHIDLKDKYLKKTYLLALPIVFGTAIQQINTIIDRTLASRLVEGSISALNYANKINEIVLGIFVASITTAIFPKLAKAVSTKNDRELSKNTYNGIVIILFVTVPATIGIIVLAEPIVKIFFERGAFDYKATEMTYKALIFYSIGMVGAAVRLMLTRIYYSIQDTKTPTINGIMATLLNVVLNLLLIGKMKHMGLALGTSISALVTTLMLFYGLKKRMKYFSFRKYMGIIIKLTIASISMGIVTWKLYDIFQKSILEGKLYIKLGLLGFIVITSVVVYVISLAVLSMIKRKKRENV